MTSDGNKILDQFGRVFDYARIAVNERCNLRCVYCMPEQGIDFQPREKLLESHEIIRIIQILADLGVRKIRFTGGEPLLSREIVHLVSAAADTPGVETVHLTTNGILLGKIADSLHDAGLWGINISLDTLDHQKFIRITRRDGLKEVLKSLSLALSIPFPAVKLNVVAMRDFNHSEIGDFVELTKDKDLTVRFIELMPFDAHQIWKTGRFFGAEKIVEELKRLYPNLEVTGGSPTEHQVFQLPGYAGKFAVIPAFTRSFCHGCNRIRLTADGSIRNCLYSDHEFSLRDIIRNGATDQDIANLLRQAMWVKPKDGWEAEHQGDRHRESMTQIGG